MRIAKVLCVVVLATPVGLYLGNWAARQAKGQPAKSGPVMTNRVSQLSVNVTLPGHKQGIPWQSPQPGMLVVKATAHITNSLDLDVFKWYVTVLTTDNVPIATTVYEKQPFRAPKGKDLHPTFADTLPMEPGTYYVHVGLCDDHPNRHFGPTVGFYETVLGH
jgi:hypothetical protein